MAGKKQERAYAQPTYIPPPSVLPAFPNAYPLKRTGKGKSRKRWKDPDSGDILEWDYQHGKLERYNDRGKHLGEFDPDTGEQTKPARPERIIAPTISTKPKEKEVMEEDTWEFYLTWFNKEGDDRILGDVRLLGVKADKVREVFGLRKDEYPGDCLEVVADHLTWLKEVAKGVDFRLNDFDYSVEVRQG